MLWCISHLCSSLFLQSKNKETKPKIPNFIFCFQRNELNNQNPDIKNQTFICRTWKNTEFQDLGHAQFGDQVVQLQNSTTILLFILTKKCNEWMCVKEMSVFEEIKETPDPYKVKRKFTRLGNEWTCCQRKREILWEREKMLKWSIST